MKHLSQIQLLADRFLAIRNAEDLFPFLEIPLVGFQEIVQTKKYNEFYVDKPGGGQRLIEDPVDELQNLQSKLASYLQSVYHLHRSSASYAFQWSVDGDVRNTRTNALQHMGNPYMFKVDFENYFHQIDGVWLERIFSEQPFRFKSDELVAFLKDLCLYKGRLPMGAPTSPILANLALHPLDKKLETLAFQMKATYTRYADDLVFSSKVYLGEEHLEALIDTIMPLGLTIKDSKTKIWGSEDPKIVTGIVITDQGLKLENQYLEDLQDEIRHYFKAKEIISIYSSAQMENLKKHEQKIEGHINYIGSIYGKGASVYLDFIKLYTQAKNTSQFRKVSWLDYNNYAFLNRSKNDPLY